MLASFSRTLRYVCSCLQKRAKTKWPSDDTVKTRVVRYAIISLFFIYEFFVTLINSDYFNHASTDFPFYFGCFGTAIKNIFFN